MAKRKRQTKRRKRTTTRRVKPPEPEEVCNLKAETRPAPDPIAIAEVVRTRIAREFDELARRHVHTGLLLTMGEAYTICRNLALSIDLSDLGGRDPLER